MRCRDEIVGRVGSEIWEGDRDNLVMVVCQRRPEADAFPLPVLFLEVPFARVAPAVAGGAEWRYELAADLVVRERLPVGIGFFAELALDVGGTPQRGDVIVFQDPGGWLNESESAGPANPVAKVMAKIGLYPQGGHLVKRVIGVEGDEDRLITDRRYELRAAAEAPDLAVAGGQDLVGQDSAGDLAARVDAGYQAKVPNARLRALIPQALRWGHSGVAIRTGHDRTPRHGVAGRDD